MARLRRSTLVWLLALVLPFQGLTVAYLDLHGPAHFHVAHDDHGHAHDAHDDHDDDHAGGHGHGHGHAHGFLDRHPHDAGDHTVVVIHEDDPEEVASGWSGVMCAAIVATPVSSGLARRAEAHAPGHDARLRTRSLPRLERPPQGPFA